MPHLSVKELQRGPTLKIMISILKVQGDNADMQTEQINVGNLVTVLLKFKCVNNHSIITCIRMKKNKVTPSNFTTTIKISGNFNELFSCSDNWVEAEMQPKGFDKNVTINSQYTLSYFIEVNITVQVTGTVIMWPSHNLYEDTEFTDFELHATDGNVSVHKTTLLAHSDVFMAIMRGEWKEKSEAHIKIDGVTVQTLKHLKDYMYLGTLPEEGLETLLVVAARYLMEILISDCVKKIIQSMKPEDFDGLVKLACQHNIPKLIRALVLRTPDDIISGIHQLEISDQGSKDNEEKSQPNS